MAKSSSAKSTSSSSSSRRNRSSRGENGGVIDNILYDVITVLHEKSKGLEAYSKYEQDLEGNEEISQIFDEIRRNDEQAVQRLAECLRLVIGEGGTESGISGSEEEEAA